MRCSCIVTRPTPLIYHLALVVTVDKDKAFSGGIYMDQSSKAHLYESRATFLQFVAFTAYC